ncbi:MAG TPA: hypothetical protein PKV98_07895 [Burkholderiaceae bacterium]|nr:hypothetical protein [Burkholderiaceae bacterium]
MSPELASKIATWRAKAIAGTLTQEEMREAIIALRADRVGAAIASDKSKRAKAKAEIPDAGDLLKEMGLDI